MKRTTLYLHLAIFTLAIILSGCSGLNTLFGIGSKKDPGTTPTLIDAMVNELMQELESDSARTLTPSSLVIPGGRSLSSTERLALRTQIKAKLSTALTAEEKEQTDRIIPIMIRETSNYMYANRASLLDSSTNADLALVQIVSVAVRAAVKSAAKEGRQELVSKNEAGTAKPVETIIAEATKEAVKSITETVTDEDVKATGVGMTVQAAVAAIEQAQTVSSDKVGSVVQATVKEAVTIVSATATSTNTNRVQEMVKQVTSNAVQATVNLGTKATAETRQNVSSQVVQVAVQAVLQSAVTNTNLQDSTTATTLVETLVAGASEAMDSFNETSGEPAIVVDSAVITAAIQAAVENNAEENTGATVPAIDTANVNAIIEETRPVITTSVITATIDTATFASSAGSLVITAAPEHLAFSAAATPSTGKTVSYSWTQIQGPTLLDLGYNGTFELDIQVDQFRPGTYVFKLTATNSGGTKSASATVTLSCTFTSSVAQEAYALGISYLKSKRYDAAYLQFAKAVDALANEDESGLANSSRLWMAILQVSSLSVDPDIVDLARNKLGFIDYPQDMETLFSNRWLTSDQFYSSKRASYLTLNTDGMSTSGYIPLRFVANSSYPRVEGERLLDDGSTSYNYIDAHIKTEVLADGTIKAEHLDYTARGYFTATGTPNCYVWSGDEVPTAQLSGTGWPELATARSLYVPEATISYYDSEWQREYFPALAPRMAIPAFADTNLFKDYEDLYSSNDVTLPESLTSRYPVYNISSIMALNVIANYGSGLNSLIDSVVAGPLARFDDIITTIDSIPDNARIDLPLDLIETYVTLDETTRAIASKFATITTGELKTFGAQLLIAKTFIELMSAYDMDYNMDALKPLLTSTTAWDPETDDLVLNPECDEDGNLVADPVEEFMTTAASPLSSLSVRNTTRLATAKSTFSSALTMVQEALVILEDRVADVIDLLPGEEDPDTGEPIQMDAELLIFGLRNAGTLFGNIQTALDEDLDTAGMVSIPQELFSNPMALMVETYDWTVAGMGLKPGRLFDFVTVDGKNLGAFSPAHMFERTIDGDFAVKVNYSTEQHDPDTGEYISTILNEDPLDALSSVEAAYYEECVGLVLDLSMREFETQLHLVGDAGYLDWLGLAGPPLTLPIGSFTVYSSETSSDPEDTEWHADFEAEAAKERLMMELAIDFIAVE